jgi:hypothetical protein
MNLEQLQAELELIVVDVSLTPYFKSWLNNAISEIAFDFSLPALKLQEPVSLTVDETSWLYDMPSSYQKNLFKCYDSDWNKITIKRNLGDLDATDPDHDETADHVTHVAVRDSKIGIYPKAAEDIKLCFYEKPTDLSASTDVPTCIPVEYHQRVIISKVVIRAYHLLVDMTVKSPPQSLAWWKRNYSEGLYGSAGGDIGMINCFTRDKKPKRSGGRNPLP